MLNKKYVKIIQQKPKARWIPNEHEGVYSEMEMDLWLKDLQDFIESIIVPPKVSEPLSKEELLDMVERGEIVLAPKPRTPIVPRYLGDEDDDSLPRTKKCIDCDEVLSRGFDFYLGDPGEKPEGPFCWTCLNKRP